MHVHETFVTLQQKQHKKQHMKDNLKYPMDPYKKEMAV